MKKEAPAPARSFVVANVENEQTVLAALLRDAAAFRAHVPRLTTGDFVAPRHQALFAALQAAFLRGLAPGEDTLLDLARELGLSYGGREYLRTVAAVEPVEGRNLDYHLERLRRDTAFHLARLGPAEDLLAALESPTAAPEDVQGILGSLARTLGGETRRATVAGDALRDEYLADLDAREGGVPLCYPALDHYLLEGLLPGKISVTAARPSVGKSTYWTAIIRRQLKRRLLQLRRGGRPKSILVLPVEAGRKSFLDGLLAGEANLDKGLFVRGRALLPEQRLRVGKAAADLTAHGLLHVRDERVRLETVEPLLATGAFDLVVWDLFQRSLPNQEREAIAAALFRLQDWAKDYGVHFALVHQISRGVEKRANKRPILEDLRDAGAYEEVADLVLLLYRHRYYAQREQVRQDSALRLADEAGADPAAAAPPPGEDAGPARDPLPPDVLEVNVAKQRNGPAGRWFGFEFQPAVCNVGAAWRGLLPSEENIWG